MLLKKGAKILANVHLHANGEDTPVDIAFGLSWCRKDVIPKHVLEMRQLASVRDLDIPPIRKTCASMDTRFFRGRRSSWRFSRTCTTAGRLSAWN